MEKELEKKRKEALEKDGVQIMRHGKGVQLFYRKDDSIFCKYEGEWFKDHKHGRGRTVYPDQSIYVGSMKYDKKDGEGHYFWPNGDVYKGNWKQDRMDGQGQFTHHTVLTIN